MELPAQIKFSKKKNLSDFQNSLNYNNNILVAPQLNTVLKIQIKCVFERSYVEETDDYLVASGANNKNRNLILSVFSQDGQKKYLYEYSYDIEKLFDVGEFTSIKEIYDNVKARIRVYPFMQKHEIKFKYACITIVSSAKIYLSCLSEISYMYRGVNFRKINYGNLKDDFIFYGCVVGEIEDSEDFKEMLKSFTAKLML